MGEQRYFHLTIGPVQAFVAQARRTRDFWAGSFLLSWLAGVAMVAVKRQGGDIKFPIPSDSFLAWITGDNQGVGEPPQQGAIPNRFSTFEVNAGFDPEQVVATVRSAWLGLAETVWQADFAGVFDAAQTAKTRAIWERQIRSFFDVSWVISDDANATNLLDCRKNWRTHAWHHEPGVSCMLMDGFQELSGVERPVKAQLEQFWRTVAEQGKFDIEHDLRDDEHLCALAYIKRRFARVFDQVAVELDGWTAHGWRVGERVPSLAHIASGRWLAQVVAALDGDADAQLLAEHVAAARKLKDLGSEREALMPAVAQAVKQSQFAADLVTLDGQCWYSFLIEQMSGKERATSRQDVSAACKSLSQLANAVGSDPSPYFAVLLMDGDSLGAQMGTPEKQRGISDALNAFTAAVPKIVSDNNGFLVYAGGDDVLALLSVTDALPCAIALRACYQQCFADASTKGSVEIRSTLSGAINIGHIKMPLRQLLFDAHPLLDDEAKEGAGRDAIAFRVWKQGQKNLTCAMPWPQLLNGDGGDLLTRLVADFGDGVVSNSFFHRLIELIDDLGFGRGENADELVLPLLKAEYQHSVGRNGTVPPDAWFDGLYQLLQVHQRQVKGDDVCLVKQCKLNADAALLVRFLLQHGHARLNTRKEV